MLLLDAISALFYFYVLLFAMALIGSLIGIKMLYTSWKNKDENGMRRAKFIMLFAAITLLCVAIVSFFETGKLPVD